MEQPSAPPEEFIEKPVIDIDVNFAGAPSMGWTINDSPDNPVEVEDSYIGFTIPETNTAVCIPLQNVTWFSVTKRVDRIPKPAYRPANAT